MANDPGSDYECTRIYTFWDITITCNVWRTSKYKEKITKKRNKIKKLKANKTQKASIHIQCKVACMDHQ